MHNDVKALALLALACLHQRENGHGEAWAITGQQQVIGQARQSRAGIVNGQGDQAIVAHASGKQVPISQAALRPGHAGLHLHTPISQGPRLSRQFNPGLGIALGGQVGLLCGGQGQARLGLSLGGSGQYLMVKGRWQTMKHRVQAIERLPEMLRLLHQRLRDPLSCCLDLLALGLLFGRLVALGPAKLCHQ